LDLSLKLLLLSLVLGVLRMKTHGPDSQGSRQKHKHHTDHQDTVFVMPEPGIPLSVFTAAGYRLLFHLIHSYSPNLLIYFHTPLLEYSIVFSYTFQDFSLSLPKFYNSSVMELTRRGNHARMIF